MISEVGGAGGAYSYSALKRLDQVWSRICSAKPGGVCARHFSNGCVINVSKLIDFFCDFAILSCSCGRTKGSSFKFSWFA